MAGHRTKLSGPGFTRSKMEALKRTVKGAPPVADDLAKARFRQHAIQAVKNGSASGCGDPLRFQHLPGKDSCEMKIICFGDSNTFGYDPRSWFGGRYEADCRWVDILAEKTGREILSAAPLFPADTDLLIVMLRTNDLLQGKRPEQAAGLLRALICKISIVS